MLTSAPRFTSLSLLLWSVLALGCSGGGGVAGDADGGPALDVPPVRSASFGVACQVDDDCATGLCLASDHAPFAWCARTCERDAVGTFCPQPDDEPPALCIEYPDATGDPIGQGFQSRGGIRRFCAPLCVSAADCGALDPRFVCDRPEWRGNPLYADTADRVCRGETIGGYDPGGDPTDCDGWETDARFADAVFDCAGYCEYLAACRELPENLTETCCGRACYARMTEGDRVDSAYARDLNCYTQYFVAFRDGALVCSEPRAQCGGAPPIPGQ